MEIFEYPASPAKESPQVEKTRLKLLQQLNEFSKILQTINIPESTSEIALRASASASPSPTIQKIRKILEERYFPQGK